ncbi:hypothetical protein N7527_002446 [Penicillium freii]|nr:hypothetical protein N7527_002446 [Penicillium freii]
MPRVLFTEEEVQLASKRQLKYIRTAKVSISQIQFDPPLPRDLDPKNLDRLRRNHYRRLDINNHVPAIVSLYNLANTLRKANISQQSLLTTDTLVTVSRPELRYYYPLIVSGRTELRTFLVEEYANKKKPTDSKIYRKIRQYKGDYNKTFRER